MRIDKLLIILKFFRTSRVKREMITEILCVLAFFVAAMYLGVSPVYSYWKKKGVKYIKPAPFFGNAWEFYRMKKTTGQIFKVR